MRVAMRQLLSRKSNHKLSDEDAMRSKHAASLQPTAFAAERAFPIRNPRDILGLPPNVKLESLVSTCL